MKTEIKLWKFYWDCGRMGSIDGLFLASSKDVENLFEKRVYFGEVLGKFSEIYGTIKERNFKEIEVDAATIEALSKYGPTLCGRNPLDYYEEEEEEDDY
ncbi:MAG: hypothetical protein ACR2MS_07760 [Weeksellaceae bacterium]